MRAVLAMARWEIRLAFKRPLFWVFLLLNSLFSIFYFFGNVVVATGSGGRAADEVVHLNGPYALTLFYMAVPFVMATLFAAIAMAGAVVRDEELKVEELLRSTHVSARGYVLGKLIGTAAWVFGVVLFGFALAVATDALTSSLAAGGGTARPEAHGPTNFLFHLHPFLTHTVPWLLFAAAGAFYLGVRTRAPLLVYGTLALLFVAVLMLGEFEPEWVQRWSKDALGLEWGVLRGWLDPTGLSWLVETYGREDRGVRFYNESIPALTIGIAANRIVLLLLASSSIWRSVAAYRRQRHGRLDAARAPAATSGGKRIEAGAAALPLLDRVRSLGRGRSSAGMIRVLRAELKMILRQPSFWIFLPIIWTIAPLGTLSAEGPWNANVIMTSNQASARLVAALTIWACGYAACLAIESIHRERTTGVADVLYSTAVTTRSLVLGKIAAVFTAMLVMIGGAAAIAAGIQVVTHQTSLDPRVYARNLAFLLLPGVLFFIALTAFLTAFFRSRMAAYGGLIGFTVLFAIGRFSGWLDWRGMIVPTNLVIASDITELTPYAKELALNRALVLSITLVLMVLSVYFLGRTDRTRTERMSWRRLRAHKLAAGGVVLLLATTLAAGVWLAHEMNKGPEAKWREDAAKEYARQNRAKWGRRDAPLPEFSSIDFDVEFFPSERRFELDGRFTFVNRTATPIHVIPLTTSLDWDIETAGHVFFADGAEDGRLGEPEVRDRNHLYEIRLDEPLTPGATRALRLRYGGTVRPGAAKSNGSFGEWILEDAVFVHSFGTSFLPTIGFQEPDAGDTDTADDRADERELARHYEGDHVARGGMRGAMNVTARVTVPRGLTAVGVGSLVDTTDGDTTSTWTFQTDHPVYFYALMAGRYETRVEGDCAVLYHAAHDRNVDDIATALDRSRRFYSAVFSPFPFEALRIVEFPGIATFAMGFPTLIPFSESIGFLTKADDGVSNVNFMVTAHEVAHQWWGTITWPAENVPGAQFLTEALAHYSTLLMEERFNGGVAARNRRIRFEREYLSGRHHDVERPIVRIDGSEPGDQTTWYNKGGLAFWMTSERIGRDRFIDALRAYVAEFSFQDDHPTIHDLLRHVRDQAGPEHDDFLRETFYEVALPRPEIVSAETRREGDAHVTSIRVRNDGTGTAALVAEVSNRRLLTTELGAMPRPPRLAYDDLEDPIVWEADDATGGAGPAGAPPSEPYESARAEFRLAEGREQVIEVRSGFEPGYVTLDPDARILMSGRGRAHRAIRQ